MMNKFRGYTLSEVLITLTIVGVLALLTVPSIVKEITNKSRVALVKNTVSNLNNAVQNELVRTRLHDLSQTNIIKDTDEFFSRSFDTVSIGENELPFAELYYPMEGQITGSEAIDLHQIKNDNSNVALLKNGVAIAIYTVPDDDGDYTVAIDINGKDDPNIVGVDYFELKLISTTKSNSTGDEIGQFVGDLGSYKYDTSSATKLNNVKSLCSTMEEEQEDGEGNVIAARKPDAKACYYLLELSGFNSDYYNNVR